MTSTPTACPSCNGPTLNGHCLSSSCKPRQPDTSARDAAAEAYGIHIVDNMHSLGTYKQADFKAGADWGHAQATAQMGAKLESAEEGERYYRREWESACERVDYAQEERDQERQRAAELCKALEEIDRGFGGGLSKASATIHRIAYGALLAAHGRGADSAGT